jgi:MYXO-CTERM domain-containing protein
VAGFSWTCVASGPFSLCPRASGTGSISTTAVDIGAGGTVTFTLTGVLPVTSSGEQANNTVRIVPPPGTVDPDCSPGCDATVSVPISSALPITGPDLMAETSAGTALVAIGGLVLLTTRRRRRRDAADA